ncbi:hypothetical protein TeGR_g83 [Tetraparma gracilis]|uniref:Uncharacterized protein n=1 Tax=Tetraparma gracilis TaxID=2962635 RepID=A0ABQ6MIB9_9STRA|nr:hypothetical protein TeGR_g83 [Tetraparma gracilis]
MNSTATLSSHSPSLPPPAEISSLLSKLRGPELLRIPCPPSPGGLPTFLSSLLSKLEGKGRVYDTALTTRAAVAPAPGGCDVSFADDGSGFEDKDREAAGGKGGAAAARRRGEAGGVRVRVEDVDGYKLVTVERAFYEGGKVAVKEMSEGSILRVVRKGVADYFG